jgi:Ca2+-binding RTX toxin-like protein
MKSFWNQSERRADRGRKVRRSAKPERTPFEVESLEERELLSLSFSFGVTNNANGSTVLLSVHGSQADAITISCKNDFIKVNKQTVKFGDGSRVPCAKITDLHVSGGPGANVFDLRNVLTAHYSNLKVIWVHGGAGNDTIYGSDLAHGEELRGEEGNDTVYGYGGDDVISGGGGDDSLDGGTGHDLLSESANVNFHLTDAALAGLGSDVLIGIEEATLHGGPSANLIDASGFSGDVNLFGHAGKDTLIGGPGDDLLDGGFDGKADKLTGGAGADTFVRYGQNVIVFGNPDWILVEPEDVQDYLAGTDHKFSTTP